jgi:transcriptional regulator with AAA-type ATPase domain/tetratricopeptide (TPR) repeat protein
MEISLDTPLAEETLLHSLRSLILRGRHAEADRAVRARRKRLAGEHGRIFLSLRAEIEIGLGRFQAALAWVSEALRGLEPGHGLRRTLEASRIRALVGLGRFRDAEAAIEAAPIEPAGTDLSFFRGQVALHSGRLGQAARLAAEACAFAASTRQRAKFVEALLLRSRVSRELGEIPDARRALESARGASNGLRDVSVLASVLSERADLMAHSGRWSDAGRDASHSGRLFARALSPHEHLSAGRRTGLLGLAQGEPHEALPAIERAADVARRGFGTTECRAEIDLLLADAQLAGRDPEGALERATAALSFFRCAQDPGGLARAHVRRSLAALSASNMNLAFREARIAGAIKDAGPVAEGLADIALGRVLLRKERSSATAPFDRAANNRSLYPPLRSVATLGAALASGASLESDEVRASLAKIEEFGDRRILAIVRSDLRELPGVEIHSPGLSGSLVLETPEAETDEPEEFLPGLIGTSRPVRELSVLVRRAAPSDLPVSIYGETGVGKENVARAIHELSPRASRKFVPVNAASLSDELFESHIFGHARGSFTGAQTDRPGLVEDAKGGTLFIDEIADLSMRSQISLLRFLEDGTYRRVGENHERRVEVRVVVAANQSLEDLVAAGRFRKDLLYRLRGLCVDVPPLRARGRDIVRLARHFVAKASSGSARLSPSSEAEILAYSWPGNVRELKQEMKRAVVLSETRMIEWTRPRSASAGPARPHPSVVDAPDVSLQTALGGFERTLLKSALARSGGRAEAARLLGISRQALHQKILRLGL